MSLRFDFDTDRWVYVPSRFPWNGYETEVEWLQTVAGLAAEAFGYDDAAHDDLFRALGALLRYPRQLSAHRFACLGTPDGRFAYVEVIDVPTMPEADFDGLLGLPEPAATRPPEVTEIVGGLGVGRRAVRYLSAPELGGEIVASINWAWRTGEQEVVMTYGTSNLVQLDGLLPVLDAFAQSMSPDA